MDEEAERPSPGDLCPRCLQPVPRRAQTCPNCHTRLSTGLRRLPIYIGIAGVLALLFVMWAMLSSARNQDLEQSPAGTEQSAPPPKDKPPALNQ